MKIWLIKLKSSMKTTPHVIHSIRLSIYPSIYIYIYIFEHDLPKFLSQNEALCDVFNSFIHVLFFPCGFAFISTIIMPACIIHKIANYYFTLKIIFIAYKHLLLLEFVVFLYIKNLLNKDKKNYIIVYD